MVIGVVEKPYVLIMETVFIVQDPLMQKLACLIEPSLVSSEQSSIPNQVDAS